MRAERARSVRHKNGDMTATCCVCGKKKREPEIHWSDTPVGLDFIAYTCSQCAGAGMEKASTKYKEGKR